MAHGLLDVCWVWSASNQMESGSMARGRRRTVVGSVGVNAGSIPRDDRGLRMELDGWVAVGWERGHQIFDGELLVGRRSVIETWDLACSWDTGAAACGDRGRVGELVEEGRGRLDRRAIVAGSGAGGFGRTVLWQWTG
ncbi:hypothetical protein ACLOJK_036898 [Asimina triloba]